ncbi:MAG: nucleotidyltransferase domain-containing protein [Deltaproteobacteria bacterium]|jgi:predicted nucleotidyltransferase|nr:nucleotidyltransferase domain-containing protein [Deltaproteobacteria bacterium]
MIYTIEQIKELVEPIAIKYKLKAVWIFGSYARGAATEESDVDILIDKTDSILVNLYDFYRINVELDELLKIKVDLISTEALYIHQHLQKISQFVQAVTKERKLIYDRERQPTSERFG